MRHIYIRRRIFNNKRAAATARENKENIIKKIYINQIISFSFRTPSRGGYFFLITVAFHAHLPLPFFFFN